MYSIKNNVDNTIIIKKSKFITKLYKINNINEINDILSNLKKEYKDATHICYAYIIGGIEKCCDDGEPSGTAGLPILNVLQRQELNYILGVVIRYFGGVKLGAGGLVRAYSNSVTDALKLSDKVMLINGFNITITFNYDNNKLIDNLLNNFEIIKKLYDEKITYEFNIIKEDFDKLEIELKKLCIDININENILLSR